MTITADVGTAKPLPIWTEQNLFRKYTAKRNKAMQTITATLQDLKHGAAVLSDGLLHYKGHRGDGNNCK